MGDSESRIVRFRIVQFQGRGEVALNIDGLRFRLAILSRISAILVSCDSSGFCVFSLRNYGNSWPAMGIVRLEIRDSAPVRFRAACLQKETAPENKQLIQYEKIEAKELGP